MKKIAILVFFSVLLSSGYGQSVDRFVYSSAYVDSDAKGEWVLGEALVGDFAGTSGTLHNGFLQTDLITTHFQSWDNPDFLFNTYPNPTDGFLHLMHNSPRSLQVVIFDMIGRQLIYKKNVSSAETINLYSLPCGTYTLRYSDGLANWGVKLILKTN